MIQTRIKGFVVGTVEIRVGPGPPIWKVRVTEKSSGHYNQKFVAASIHGGIELAQGLSVTFLLGRFRRNNQDVLKAVDVKIDLGYMDVEEPAIHCDHCRQASEVNFEVSNTTTQEAHYARTCLEHLQLAVSQLKTCVPAEQREIRFWNVSRGDTESRRWPEVCGS